MHNKVVIKFGGTSVKTKQAIEQIHKITSNKNNISCIVVSAVGGVTNLLVKFCNATPLDRQKLANEILQIHLDLSSSLDLELDEMIKEKMQKLYTCNLEKFNTEQADDIVSLGEDLSSTIICEFLSSRGIKIERIDARNFISTDNRFGRATPDIKAIKDKLLKVLPNENTIFITQGFIGSDSDGKTTTLGRGGSDYSAALIAEALNASELFIYTDVLGVYTMDPNIVQEARVIDELSFSEMAEMANFGAKVLHPDTIEPCVRSNIPIRILSTFDPDKKGTRVFLPHNADSKDPLIHAVTMRKLQILVTIKSLKMVNTYGFIANIFSILSKYKIGIDLITTSEASVALTVDGNAFNSNPFFTNKNLMGELAQFADISIENSLTLVAVVGNNLTLSGMLQSILSKLGKGFVRLICYGASSSSMGILIRDEDAESVARSLHKQLLENQKESP